MVLLRKRREIARTRPIACKRNSDILYNIMTDGRERVRSVLSKIRIGIFLLSPSTLGGDDEGAHVGCQSGLRPRDTPLGLILLLVPTLLPIP